MGRWRDYLEPGDGAVSLAGRPEPEPDVPRALGVLFGPEPGWSPDREAARPGHCRICGDGRPRPDGSEATLIPPGSRLVCAGCLRYGLDDRVRALLAITPAKPRHRPHVAKTPKLKPAGRRERRARDPSKS